MEHDKEIDTRGLNCPLPILRTKKALGDVQSGQVLKVVATDPGSVKDFETFSKQTGHALLSHARRTANSRSSCGRNKPWRSPRAGSGYTRPVCGRCGQPARDFPGRNRPLRRLRCSGRRSKTTGMLLHSSRR